MQGFQGICHLSRYFSLTYKQFFGIVSGDNRELAGNYALYRGARQAQAEPRAAKRFKKNLTPTICRAFQCKLLIERPGRTGSRRQETSFPQTSEEKMKSKLTWIFAAIFVLHMSLIAQDVAHDTDKAAKDTAHATKKATKKTAHATDDAAKDTAHATDKGAKDAAHGTKVVAKDTAHGTKVVAKDTAHGTEKAADKTADVSKDAAKDTAHGAKKVGHGIKKAADKTADTVK